MWGKLKLYLYAAAGAIFAALMAYVKYLQVKNDHLEEKVEEKEDTIKDLNTHIKNEEKTHQEEKENAQAVIQGESEKAQASDEVKDILDKSEETPQEVTL